MSNEAWIRIGLFVLGYWIAELVEALRQRKSKRRSK
jgi:hypothetical protein